MRAFFFHPSFRVLHIGIISEYFRQLAWLETDPEGPQVVDQVVQDVHLFRTDVVEGDGVVGAAVQTLGW